MNKIEILQYMASIHNRLVQISVSGDGAILMGDTLKDLRTLVKMLQEDVASEQEAVKEKPPAKEVVPE